MIARGEQILILILILIAFFLRLVAVKNAETSFDTYGHIYFAKEVKAQKTGPSGQIVTKVVGSTGFSQPFLWHWLISLFPIDQILRYQKWINAGLDAGFSLLVYVIALRLDFTNHTAFYIALLYLLTPMWFSRLAIGPRIAGLTPRLSSELATNLFFVVTLLPLGLPNWLTLLCGAALSAFVLMSSKFGLQAMILLVPLTALITWHIVPFVALALGFTVAIGLGRNGFRQSAHTQLNHLIWYFRENAKAAMPISNRNSLKTLFLRRPVDRSMTLWVGVILHRMIAQNSFTGVVFKMPVLPTAIALYAATVMRGTVYPPLSLIGPVIAATLVFFLINLPPLLFLGEAERYLNHVAFFIVTAAVLAATSLGVIWIILPLIVYGLLYWFIESFFLHKFAPVESQGRQVADNGVIAFLRSIPQSGVVLGYPYHAGGGAFRIMLETEHKVVFCFTVSQDFGKMFDTNYAADYPYVKLEMLDELAREFGVTVVIITKKSLVSRGLNHWVPSFQWQKLDVGQPIYDVYQRVAHE